MWKSITWRDLLDAGLVQHKKRAQDTLKYNREKGSATMSGYGNTLRLKEMWCEVHRL
ncbi:MAG TPA: hypothetical protein VH500_08205 [Nitrososphaeraceae archaeon]|jgi:hypothetical protein